MRKRTLLRVLSLSVFMLTMLLAPLSTSAAPPVPPAGEDTEVVQPEAGAALPQAAPVWGDPATVTAWDGLRLREGPSLSDPVVLVLTRGETVYPGAAPQYADGYTWVYVRVYRYGRFYEGFCAAQYLSGYTGYDEPQPEPVPQPETTYKVVAKPGLRLRSAPDLSAAIMRVVPYGTLLSPLGVNTTADGYEWTQVAYAGGVYWCAKMYVVPV